MATKPVVLRFASEGHLDFDGDLKSFRSPADIVAFERTYSTGLGHLEDDPHLEWILFLVWRAYRREHESNLEFEAFLDDLAEWDFPSPGEGEEAEPDPTRPAAPSAGSPQPVSPAVSDPQPSASTTPSTEP